MAWSRFERLTVIGLAGFVLGLWLAGCARGFSRGPWDGGTDGWESFDSSADDEGGRPVCGNGVVEDGEECDDGNSVDGDGCSASCELEASCGPESCPNGCCDAQGRCLSGNGDSSCGTGGAACRDCAASGLICLQGTCQRPGDCNPGDTAPCDRCGYRQCQADGTWGPCQDQGECEPNTSQVQGNCQRCGTLVRICNSNCEWEPTQCMNQGDCEPGDVQQGGGCERCGHEERTCQSNCTWGPTRCVGQGECDPGTHRDCGDCGRQDCSSSCTYGSCYAYYSCPSGQTCDSSGQCVNGCGDGQCDAGEDCASCPEDCGPPGHLGTGAHGDPCPNVPDNTWRCVLVHYQWGDDWTSQVCRNGSWVNYNEAPRDCPHCCWDYSTACNQ